MGGRERGVLCSKMLCGANKPGLKEMGLALHLISGIDQHENVYNRTKLDRTILQLSRQTIMRKWQRKRFVNLLFLGEEGIL